MITLTLPVSKHVVEIRDTITYGEYLAIKNYMVDRMSVESDGKEKKIELQGQMIQQMKDKMAETFLHSCRGSNGQEISTLGLLNTLDVIDGKMVADKIAEVYEEIKKKLGETESE